VTFRRTLARWSGLLAAVLLTAAPSVGPAFAYSLAAASGSPASTLARAPLGQYAETVTFTVNEISPDIVTSDIGTVRLTGMLHNTSDRLLRSVVGRIQRGEKFLALDDLAAHAVDPGQPQSSWSPFVPLSSDVPPGGEVPFEIEVAAFSERNAGLNIDEPGVYPLMLNVNSEFDEGPANGARVGEFHLLLTVASVPAALVAADPDVARADGARSGTSGTTSAAEQFPPEAAPRRSGEPVAPRAQQHIDVLLPLIDRPHRDPTGAFFDDDLVPLLQPGGRLDRVLRFAENSSLPAGSISLAVDPELLEELDLMSAGYFVGPNAIDISTLARQASGADEESGTSQDLPSGPSSTTDSTPGGTTASPGSATSSSNAGSTPPPQSPTGVLDSNTGTTSDSTNSTASSSAEASSPLSAGSEMDFPSSTTASSPSTTAPAFPTSTRTDTPTISGSHPGASTSEATPSSAPVETTSAAAEPLPGPNALPGSGTAAAQSFLDRLRDLAGDVRIVVLPYADVDVTFLLRHNFSAKVATAITQGRRIATDLLGEDANLLTDVGWPLGGFADEATMNAFSRAGIDSVVLSPSAVLPVNGRTPVRGVIPARGGEILATMSGADFPQGALARNEFTAVTAQRYFTNVSGELLYAARTPEAVEAVYNFTPILASLTDAGMLAASTTASPEEFAAEEKDPIAASSDGTPLTLDYPDSALVSELGERTYELIQDRTAMLVAVQGAFTPEDAAILPGGNTAPSNLFTDITDRLILQYSGGYRSDPEAGSRSISAIPALIADLQSGVVVATPDNSYTLTSSTSPLPVVVRNDLPYDVHLRLRVNAVDAERAGLTIQDAGVQIVPAGWSQQILLPAEINRAGPFTVRVQLTTPTGLLWGAEQRLQMRSTAYGAFTITLVSVAGGIVLVTASMRIYKLGKARKARIAAGLQ
jgi:hypothetical protein